MKLLKATLLAGVFGLAIAGLVPAQAQDVKPLTILESAPGSEAPGRVAHPSPRLLSTGSFQAMRVKVGT